jgi:hypothetical protein
MSINKKVAETEQVYEMDEKAIYAPLSGARVDCTIVKVPGDGERKYLIETDEKTENGTLFTVNPCYLRKKE